MDYVMRAVDAITGDFGAYLALQPSFRIDNTAVIGKYENLNLFLQGIMTAKEIVRIFQAGTFCELAMINDFYKSHPVIRRQLSRIPNLDVILITTGNDLIAALEQAKPELETMLEAVLGTSI